MRIGDLARQADVTLKTVRHYEHLGLIPRGEREGQGQHRYPASTIARLKKIDQLKRLGLSLDEVRGVIELYFADPTGRRAKRKVLAIVKHHLAETEKKLKALTDFRAELQGYVERIEQYLQAPTE